MGRMSDARPQINGHMKSETDVFADAGMFSRGVGKLFVDYLRNGFGATTVSAWSARARPGMGVSVPVAWDELPDLKGGAHWDVQSIGERLAIGNKPWKDYAASAKSLKSAMKLMDFKPAKP